jgi:hypothetical protein
MLRDAEHASASGWVDSRIRGIREGVTSRDVERAPRVRSNSELDPAGGTAARIAVATRSAKWIGLRIDAAG